MSRAETTSSANPSRSSGASYSARIEQEKNHREKARSLKPLLKLWPFVSRYPGQLTLFIIFLMASSAMSLILPAIVRLVVDCGFGDGAATLAYCQKIPLGDEQSINAYFRIAIVFGIAFSIFGSLRFFFITRLGQRVIADIRKAVFDRLTTLSPAYFERVRTGEVLSRLTTDTTVIEGVITGSISFAIRSLAQIIGSIILMFVVSVKLAAMVLLIIPAIIIPLVFAGRRIRSLSRSGQDRLADASARGGEAISAIQTVQAYTQEDKERQLFGDSIEASFSDQRRRIAIQSLLTFLIMAMVITGIISILQFGANSVSDGKMTSGAIMQFTFYAGLVVAGMATLPETITNLMRAAGASDRIVEILNARSDIQSPDTPYPSSDIRGKIEFKDVNFAYPSRPDMPALHGVSFTINPGETVALVGPSGAGKSTVFQILLRFYDVQGGTITIDGTDVSDFDPQDLRSHMAVVQQDTPLFSGSAKDNIGYGRDGASDEDIVNAAKAAFADTFIQALPNGYDTDLGERSSTLSGGQKQRIAIARAILRNAPILLLDEATSALDSESERAVQKAFETMSANRTTLVIAHRLSTVLRADKIIVFENGQIIETGTHKALMAKDGLYAHLANIQFDQSAALKE